jgi:hypothetical protein
MTGREIPRIGNHGFSQEVVGGERPPYQRRYILWIYIYMYIPQGNDSKPSLILETQVSLNQDLTSLGLLLGNYAGYCQDDHLESGRPS